MLTGDLTDVEYTVRTIAGTAIANEKHFGDLDAVVGDGDFGYSLARGFEQVLADWESYDRADIGMFLKRVALTITKTIGGTSGPLWGTAFLRAGGTIGAVTEVDSDTVVAALRAAAGGITDRGQAELGDKTLLDSLVPAIDSLAERLAAGDGSDEAVLAFATAARAGADATAALRARRGRASYTGERSIGSVDAGAVAVAVIAEQIASGWTDRRRS